MSDVVTIRLAGPDDSSGWLKVAPELVSAGVAPARVLWETGSNAHDLFSVPAGPAMPPAGRGVVPPHVPQPFVALAEHALLHVDRERFALMYRLLWRSRGQPALLDIAADADVSRVRALAQAVRRDMHKMTAFVRFRQVKAPGGVETFVAWFEPSHHIVAATAPFFMRRFANMCWSILTPEASAHWDRHTLVISGGARAGDAPSDDVLEDIWKTYFASIFNPARLKVKAMQAEMPKKYWRNLPEAALIPDLVRAAALRAEAMVAAVPRGADRRIPPRAMAPTPGQAPAGDGTPAPSLDRLAEMASRCTRCPLYEDATQTVMGDGPSSVSMMLVGEQPGDQEDLAGRPFVGPAGKLLNTALERVGIERTTVYLTNAVKHFKFEPRGKRRIHKRPNVNEIERCRWWLDEERRLMRPRLIVALGATAARGVTGVSVTVGDVRGTVARLDDDTSVLVTVHPSYLLRLTDQASKRTEWNRFLADLRVAKDFLAPA